MKKLLFTLTALPFLFTSCVKEPEACIQLSPGNEVEVFEELTMTSCSENAETLEWEVQGPTLFFFSEDTTFTGESGSYNWHTDGTYTVELKAISKNESKENSTTETITVVDVCYECYNASFQFTTEECHAYYFTKAEFDAAIADRESSGYVCTKKTN